MRRKLSAVQKMKFWTAWHSAKFRGFKWEGKQPCAVQKTKFQAA
jgi:hypothetical protein